MSYKGSFRKRVWDPDDDEEDKFYNLKVLVNGTSVNLELTNPQAEMPMRDFVNLVREQYDKARRNCEVSGKKRKTVCWNSAAACLDFYGVKIKDVVRFDMFKPDLCNILRLDDGSGEASTMYENMWDLTPDTEMLKELPENYSFETALADLIDNSLQAVWSCPPRDRRLISVDVLEDRISVFDSGPGMDSNSIVKWGKIGASVHRSQKPKAIGGKPPYLMPFFGMFGYGGAYACMFLGRRTLLSSKTKESNKVFTLQLDQEALIDNRCVSGKKWTAAGGVRDPSEEEIKLSSRGSFTKVEIFECKCKIPEIYQLRCKLKDIYFPYIQCDEISKTGRTERPVEFQVCGMDLAAISGGVVATTNLNSMGREFWFQLRFTVQGTLQEANARLKFAYFPVLQGKESIDVILESLQKKLKVSENFQTFRRVSVRRLGRLLPDVPWASIPFMERGARATTLRKCCERVICFVDLDAGFSPTPSKTDLARHSALTVALKSFGSKSKENDSDVDIVIHKDTECLGYGQVEQSYQEWVLEMHKTYDVEDASGEDEAIFVFDSLDNKALCISPECKVVRVHKAMKRKGTSWKRGKKVRILKGACAGVHKNDVYATIDYFLIEGFSDEAGGDARIICRQIEHSEGEGCALSVDKGISRLDIRSSSSFPISIIDSGKCLLIDENEWSKKLQKKREKDPSQIDLLDTRDCRALNFKGESTLGDSVSAGQTPPQQIVAVVRPGSFTSPKASKKLDQKHIVKMDGEMLMEVELQEKNMKSRNKNIAKPLYSLRSFPISRAGFHGLYIFPLESKFPDIFKKAGIYNFCFSVGNSITCKKKVVVRPSSKVGSWKLADNVKFINVCAGSSLPPCSIACFDEFENHIPFSSVPSLNVILRASSRFEVTIDKIEASLTNNGVLKLKNMLVETDDLDLIRPDYKAILKIFSKDEPFSVSVACKVDPGPVKHVVEKNPHALEKLLPDSTIEDYILEMFDRCNNHGAQGTNVLICIDGFSVQDSVGLKRKVDSDGCVDLSGILKVTAGYGKSVSISVISDNKEIFKKESLIEKRELRLLTKLRESYTAGSNLANLVFKVTDSDGSIDTSIHSDEKSGCVHMMSIESDARSVESAVRYAFIHGVCKLTSLSLPETEGVFSFKVFHSRYPELNMSFKIQLTPAETFERDEIGCSTSSSRMVLTPPAKMASTTNPGVVAPTQQTPCSQYRVVPTQQTPCSQYRVAPTQQPPFSQYRVAPTQQTPSSEFRVVNIRESPLVLGSQTGLMDILQYTENLKEKLVRYSERKVEADEHLECLEAEKEQAEKELSTLQASLGPLSATFPEILSSKGSVMRKIEEKHHDTAAWVFCCLYRNAPAPQSLFLAKKGVFGIIALLGSVSSTSLSRVLSEYLGEETMLALVCKASRFVQDNAEYLRLQSEAEKLGISITGRFDVLCLDSTRLWDGVVNNDPQKTLALDNPKLPNGDPIPGFVGYAVNMINVDPEELNIQTYAGHGLRQTLFYDLFGRLQVYETQEHVVTALPHINGRSAVSLDGFIAKDNRFIYCGSSKPEIQFPVMVRKDEEEKLRKLEGAKDKVTMVAKKIMEEKLTLKKLEKKLKKTNERYYNARQVPI